MPVQLTVKTLERAGSALNALTCARRYINDGKSYIVARKATLLNFTRKELTGERFLVVKGVIVMGVKSSFQLFLDGVWVCKMGCSGYDYF